VTRIGILSFDHLHAESYQENLKKIPDVQLVGFSHENSEEGAEIARKFGIKWFPEHNELLAAGLDGAVICSVTNNHRKLVELAANAGCQILCEKPIATSVADSEAMRSAFYDRLSHALCVFGYLIASDDSKG
jgi:predicted dehydrogenase